MGWLIAFGVLLLVGFTRLRLRVWYQAAGFAAYARVGPVRIKLFPRKKKKPPVKEAKVEKAVEKAAPKGKRKPIVKITWDAFKDIKSIAGKTLRRVSRLFRFELIELRLTSGGRDAAKAAIRYGEWCAIVHTAFPAIKNWLRIKKEAISIGLDYNLPKTTCFGEIRVSVSIGRMVVFGLQSAFSLLGFYLKHRTKNEREVSPNGQRRQAQAG